MNIHLTNDFKDAITAASEHLQIREAYIERDYWVTYVLNNLSASPFADNVVFKGGTSLSKVFNCIERFSEDIDLAILDVENLGDSKRKALMKDIENTITLGLSSIPDHPLTEKRGRNRKTFYQYSNAVEKKNLGPVKDVIQLEINSFTEPVPYSKESIDSLIAQYLRKTNRGDLIERFKLYPFKLNVLSMERTFFEKVLSLTRLSYEVTESLRRKIRHFYDIVKIYNKDKGILENKNSVNIFKIALNDDRKNSTFAGEWLTNPLSEAHLYKDFQSTWNGLENSYNNDLRDLIWVDGMPSTKEILDLILKIKVFLIMVERGAD